MSPLLEVENQGRSLCALLVRLLSVYVNFLLHSMYARSDSLNKNIMYPSLCSLCRPLCMREIISAEQRGARCDTGVYIVNIIMPGLIVVSLAPVM